MSGITVTAVLAAFVGPIVTYLVSAKRFSGQIETSSATELWAESKSIREWATERINTLESTVDRLEKRVRELETQGDSFEREKRQLERELARCQETR